MDIEFPSLNHLDLTEQTYRILRDRILTRQLKPGDKVSVDVAARGLGVSRTPVVSALKLLEGEGLVEILPRRGTFVTELTADDVAELFEIRLMIELYAAEQIFAKGKVNEILSAIQDAMKQMKGAIADEDYINYESFIASDRDLHLSLVSVIDNSRLVRMYSDLNIHMQVARAHYLNTVESALEAQKEHEDMLAAMRHADLEELKVALGDHIKNVRDRILYLLQERGGKL